jgi:hypothetical protein
MSKILDKETIKFICDYLYPRYTMPNSVASACLAKLGIEASASYIRSIRKKYEIRYEHDCRIHNAIQFAKSHDIEVNHEYLMKKCPDIFVEHRQYLIDTYAKKERKELVPFKVSGIAGVVTQIMMAA